MTPEVESCKKNVRLSTIFSYNTKEYTEFQFRGGLLLIIIVSPVPIVDLLLTQHPSFKEQHCFASKIACSLGMVTFLVIRKRLNSMQSKVLLQRPSMGSYIFNTLFARYVYSIVFSAVLGLWNTLCTVQHQIKCSFNFG